MTRTRLRTGLYVLAGCALLAGTAYAARRFAPRPRSEVRVYMVVLSDVPGNAVELPAAVGRAKVTPVRTTDIDERDGKVVLSVHVDQPQRSRKATSPTLVARADPAAELLKLVPAAPPPPAPIQESVQKIQRSLERFERLFPAAEDTLREYRDLAKSLRDAVPELRDSNKELQKLLKSANDMVPLTRKTIEEAQVATRNWGMVGEQANVLLRTNEDRINAILKSAEAASAGLAEAFNQENRNDLSTILRNLSTASKRFPEMSQQAEGNLRDARQTQRNLNDSLRRLDDVLDQIRGAKPGQENKAILKNFQEGSEKFNKSMSDVQELLQAVGRGDGTLKRFVSDPCLYNHLDDAALMLTRILPRLDRVLGDLEVFADKLARHPEKLGLGGVVRPDSGVKDAPSRSNYHPPRHP